jgi:uncharacterized protein (DUF433 family)
MCWGEPQLKGIGTYAVAGMVLAGEPITTVAGEYGLTRPEVLICCWFEARYGSKRRRAQWSAWLDLVEPRLCGAVVDYAAVPDPPDRSQLEAAATAPVEVPGG